MSAIVSAPTIPREVAPLAVDSSSVENKTEGSPVFFSRENLSLTSLVTPKLRGWEGLSVMGAVKKIAIELFRTIAFITVALPVIAFTADIIKNAFCKSSKAVEGILVPEETADVAAETSPVVAISTDA